MIVFTRKPGEQIMLGDNIVVTLVGVVKGKARLGIDAPPGVSIHRDKEKRPPPPAAGDVRTA